MAKPWFQRELERVTREMWSVETAEKGMLVKCTHGMKIIVRNLPGRDRPFLNEHAERQFAGKVLGGHRPWAEVEVRWPEFAL